MLQQLRTVLIFTKLNARRFFRDRIALFFVILFPLIFLFVFGALNRGGGDISFKVAVINQSDTTYSQQYVERLRTNKTFKVSQSVTTMAAAQEKMQKSQIDGIIVLPKNFGTVRPDQAYPSGQVQVLYNQNAASGGQALTSVLEGTLVRDNAKVVTTQPPFSVASKVQTNKSLSPFDYAFTGVLGFAIVGMGIFGPSNVFPELKKQGILRRLHTTPLRVWQYFTAMMLSQALTGLLAIAIQFAVAITVFDLKVNGNYFEIALFIMFSIAMILGIGLAVGGWAKNERQAVPLSNIIAFPMIFLAGTFIPRYVFPEKLQAVTNYLPLTPVIDGLRLLSTEGKHLIDLGPQLAVMAVWFVVIYAIAFRVFRWE